MSDLTPQEREAMQEALVVLAALKHGDAAERHAPEVWDGILKAHDLLLAVLTSQPTGAPNKAEKLLDLLRRVLDDDQDGYRIAPDLHKEILGALTAHKRRRQREGRRCPMRPPLERNGIGPL
jgi:hypothetical protein